MGSAQGELLVFTDDDCRLNKEYVTEVLLYDAADIEPVLRGGRVELGDQTDLPITIRTTTTRQRFNRQTDTATHDCIVGNFSLSKMKLCLALVDILSHYDTRFSS